MRRKEFRESYVKAKRPRQEMSRTPVEKLLENAFKAKGLALIPLQGFLEVLEVCDLLQVHDTWHLEQGPFRAREAPEVKKEIK
ncbi:hypothetical protein RJT34_22225 [Clitoria ternatea]|uniref:Uncharacterized protein n=1 Tax=Clitoria ternatea TaxID=43366 RepID=A0AAN9IVF8_CLITE